MSGAALRCLVRAAGHIVAGLGFGAIAWKVKTRDQLIVRRPISGDAILQLAANNARFLRSV
jgi:hypothetical protein